MRVSSNARVVPEARSPVEAIQLLEQIVALPGHQFWPDDVSIVSSTHVARRKLIGHRQVTDAHLLALVLGRGETLATFDGGIVEVLPDSKGSAKAVHLIPA